MTTNNSSFKFVIFITVLLYISLIFWPVLFSLFLIFKKNPPKFICKIGLQIFSQYFTYLNKVLLLFDNI